MSDKDVTSQPETPQAPKRHRLAGTVIRDARIPVTALKQRYVSPVSRHSQTSHVNAAARAEAAGLDGERALYEADRAKTATDIAHVADVKKQQAMRANK